MKLRFGLLLASLLLALASPVRSQELPINNVHFVAGPDISTFAQTTSVTLVDVGLGGTNLTFDKKDGPNRWPDNVTPGWTGALQYSLGLCLNIGGSWTCSAPIENWYRRQDGSGPIQQQSNTCTAGHGQVQCNWFYDGRWAPLNSHQPAPGEQVGIFVVAGDARNDYNPVRERSNIVLFNLPGEGQTAQFTYAPSAPQPVPVPTPAPTPTPAPVPTPVPSTDLVSTGIIAQLQQLNTAVLKVDADVNAGRDENKQFQSEVKSVWQQIGAPLLKYVVPAVATFFAGKAVAK
jgi:hypothetical protein